MVDNAEAPYMEMITNLFEAFNQNTQAVNAQANQQNIQAQGGISPLFPSTPSSNAYAGPMNLATGGMGMQQYGAMSGAGTGNPSANPYGANPFQQYLPGTAGAAPGSVTTFQPLGNNNASGMQNTAAPVAAAPVGQQF